MAETKRAVVERFFGHFAEDEIEAALRLTTPEIVVDNRNSNAPWAGLHSGHEGVRASYRSFRRQWDEIGGVRWEQVRSRTAGAGRLAIETRISGRGPATGLPLDARGGWLISFDGELISEAVLHQSFDEALLAGRRRAILEARLYFVCEALPGGREPSALLAAAIAGGADMIQLREKAPRCAEELISLAEPFARAAREHGAVFFLNDHPELVEACGADGVHVGQGDEPVASARAAAGPAALVGLSTHTPAEFDAAIAAEGPARPDQVSAGPVWATPTKEGRPAAGLELIVHAAAVAGEDDAWFAIGGIDADNVAQVAAAGARRIVVVRAIRDAADPEAAARELRAALI
jgi:thiamine-phosphate pyrophosphorylase